MKIDVLFLLYDINGQFSWMCGQSVLVFTVLRVYQNKLVCHVKELEKNKSGVYPFTP